MDAISLLVEGFGRVPGLVRTAVDDLDEDALAWRPDPGANSVAWLVWHLARQQDAQVAALSGQEQEWTAGGWAQRAGLPFGDGETGYGMGADDVARVLLPADLLVGYADAAHRTTMQHLSTLAEESLDEVVDERHDPPVTMAVRLVSILDDAVQHAGQAAYVRGLLQRRG